MKINYNVTGAKRKSLVGAVSQELNAQTKYLGAPTFAYEVGGYTIDRNGVLEGENNTDLVSDLCDLHDFKAVTEEYDIPLPEAEPILGNVSTPNEAALDSNITPYKDYPVSSIYAPLEVESISLTIEMPKDGFTDASIENLIRLIESKENLIKKTLGAESLPVEIGEETIRFPWFQSEQNPDETKAYVHFIAALCEMAKTQKRINFTNKDVDNEKYAFRCFLLRLGFIGPEYKNERKILLRRLTGSAAFKDGRGGLRF